MMKTFSDQNSRNEHHSVVECPATPAPSRPRHPGTMLAKKVFRASPPIQAWMPNHPQATTARISAGRFEPIVPYAARA